MTSKTTPLARELVAMIGRDGPMTVETYMGLCLGHAEHGYYMGRDPLGRAGDFITSPEVSQMFGELIGVWCAAGWQVMEAPDPFCLIELGPGRGTLMADLVRAADVLPGFAESASVHLVETSPVLRAVQEKTLGRIKPAVHWHDTLADVPDGPSLIVANEFFDALPVRQLVRSDTGWHERMVGVDRQGALAFELSRGGIDASEVPHWAQSCEPGAIVEMSPAREAYATSIGERLKAHHGGALIIDYGHVRSAPGDTVQAVRKHDLIDVLAAPGDSDVTSHVDFSALEAALSAAGAAVLGPLTQGQFLMGMGLREREAMLRKRGGARQRIVISRAAQRLAAGGQMGHLFKVIAATHEGMAMPAPFGSTEPQ